MTDTSSAHQMTRPTQATQKKALDGDASARQAYEALSYSQQRSHVFSIEDAKTPETRQRRIDKTIATLRLGRARQ